ncbi:MAG: hypothetical protein ACFFDP_13560, partial [Promethearchaeota archaeon]
MNQDRNPPPKDAPKPTDSESVGGKDTAIAATPPETSSAKPVAEIVGRSTTHTLNIRVIEHGAVG